MSQKEIEHLKQLTVKGSQTDTMSLNLIKLMDSVSSQLNILLMDKQNDKSAKPLPD